MPSITQALVSLLSAAYVGQVQAVDPFVDLGYTRLQGVAEAGGATRWLGIRYAAPPLVTVRSANDEGAGGQFRPICLPRSASDFSMKPNKRFTVAEDCLYLNIFAPSNATAESKLPIMYFIQGGGHQSNSNANFNGSQLAAFGNIMVVQINYRVGPYGFLQSKEVAAQGSLNNGLKDPIQGMKWVKKYAAAFGGDPDHIVAVGDSAGATTISMLLAAFGENDPGLFKGVIMESVSVATIRTLDEGQEQYNCLTNATGCNKQTDTLACLRSVNATALQTEDCQFNPHIDDDLVKASTLELFAQGKYLKVPTIAGTCTDEGTKNVPQDTDTVEEALKFINDQATDSLSNESLALLKETYLDKAEPVFPDSGKLWRQLSNSHGDFRAHCVTKALQDAMARDGVKTFNYRYGVLDEEQEALGFGAYHTVELNGVFGPNNTDGAPPKSYSTTNAPIVPLTMAYWASFVRTLDPNTAAIMPDMPEWKAWTVDGKERLLFQNNTGTMESMPAAQQDNCAMLAPMITFIETPATEAQKASVQLTKVSGSSAENTGPESGSPEGGAMGNGTKHDGGGEGGKGNGTKHDGGEGEGGKGKGGGGGGKGGDKKNGTGPAPTGPPAAPSSATNVGYGFSGVLSAMLVVCVGHFLLAW
ncbi:carboxylesterase [Colletotrichum eremochloae]|nr:carboxylesterase [Colletotrichum eremochloae]